MNNEQEGELELPEFLEEHWVINDTRRFWWEGPSTSNDDGWTGEYHPDNVGDGPATPEPIED